MATSMPNKEKSHNDARRVVILVPIEIGSLLTLLAQYRCVTKKTLHEEIWRAGIRSLLGVDPEDVDVVMSIPRGETIPDDIKKLTAVLLEG